MQNGRRAKVEKPLACKAYGHIPHLPGSRLGPGDHYCQAGHTRIATIKTRDKYDTVIVQEKLDGSCMAVAKINGQIVPLTRAGYHTKDSPHQQHHVFAEYVYYNEVRFNALLKEGERICGEWLYMAHGTVYNMPHEPFVPFDIIKGGQTANDCKMQRLLYIEFCERVHYFDFTTPHLLYFGPQAISIHQAEDYLNELRSPHGAIDPIEGAIWRIERNQEVDFLVKYVRPFKIDGKYFPENNDGKILLNTFKPWTI